MNSSIEKFLEKASNDETLKKEMADAEQKMSSMDPEAGFNKFLKPIINKAGFDFSFAELMKSQQQNMPQGELDDNALENVAGGRGVCVIIGAGTGTGCFIGGGGDGCKCVIVGNGNLLD